VPIGKMKNNKRKLFAYMDIKNNEQGMTFISMLMAFIIILITLPFIIYFLTHLHESELNEDISLQQFFIFLRDDALFAENVFSEDNKLYFSLNTGEVAKIEQYNNVIRRQVDSRGHEIYMRNIESFTLQPMS